VQLLEQVLPLGRRGKLWGPFCQSRHVQPRGYSGRLQRILTDFGADDSFAASAVKYWNRTGQQTPGRLLAQLTTMSNRILTRFLP
jgi:hypothetical protein